MATTNKPVDENGNINSSAVVNKGFEACDDSSSKNSTEVTTKSDSKGSANLDINKTDPSLKLKGENGSSTEVTTKNSSDTKSRCTDGVIKIQENEVDKKAIDSTTSLNDKKEETMEKNKTEMLNKIREGTDADGYYRDPRPRGDNREPNLYRIVNEKTGTVEFTDTHPGWTGLDAAPVTLKTPSDFNEHYKDLTGKDAVKNDTSTPVKTSAVTNDNDNNTVASNRSSVTFDENQTNPTIAQKDEPVVDVPSNA